MRHRIDDQVRPQAISAQAVFQRVLRIINPFPGIAVVGIARNENHDAAIVIGDGFIVRRVTISFIRDPSTRN